MFSGVSSHLPYQLTQLINLVSLQLEQNSIVGKFPYFIGRLSYLKYLNLKDNLISGQIPFSIGGLSSLEELDVIKGREDIYSTILGLVLIVDLSCNSLSEGIASELVTLRTLQSPNLSRNRLTRSIPKNIGDMKSLISFDVSLNGLSGELPLSLSSLNFLSNFNVSYNNLTGRVPTSTQLQSFSESSFFGNNLCGDPLPKSCTISIQDVHHEDKEEKDTAHIAYWGMIISTVCGFTRWRIAYFGFLREFKYMWRLLSEENVGGTNLYINNVKR
ncbi:uncharacterized protein LOC143567208 [Bidens hawaiensis]|uniref:uncharacterized protein LOC143567208 n=1 Tax=Bidens hawaiensis TaxID=980011 RepID=UPI00404955D0